jgi:hypothetical protein
MAYDSSYATKNMMNEVGKSNPAFANPAIARCCKAWKKVYRAAMEETDWEAGAAKKAGEAYRAAMPPLTSRESCRDFLTCVAHGILLGAIAEKNGGKLLYAAQIALAMANSQQNSQNSSPSYPNLTDSEAKRAQKFEDSRRK